MATNFVDNSDAVLRQMRDNVSNALYALGTACVGAIVRQMDTGYGSPIRRTGNLMRDVQYEINRGEQRVRVGNTLYYAPYVHDGTCKMAGRPYISDALVGMGDELRGVVVGPLQRNIR